MKSKHITAKKTVEEVKKISQYFCNPSHSSPRDDLSIDWSEDIPEAQSSPTLCASPASEHVSSPQVLLSNSDSMERSRAESNNSGPSVLNYGNNQPSIASSWDGAHHVLSIFGTQKTTTIDAANITQSISRMIDYFKHNLADKKLPAGEFADVVKALWGLITMIYTSRWDLLPIEDKKIRKLMGKKIVPGYMKLRLVNNKTAEKSSVFYLSAIKHSSSSFSYKLCYNSTSSNVSGSSEDP